MKIHKKGAFKFLRREKTRDGFIFSSRLKSRIKALAGLYGFYVLNSVNKLCIYLNCALSSLFRLSNILPITAFTSSSVSVLSAARKVMEYATLFLPLPT